MLTFAAVVFWTCLALIVYVYAGYPVAAVPARIAAPDAEARAKPARLPKVSLIISAYNEEDVIREKIINTPEPRVPA